MRASPIFSLVSLMFLLSCHPLSITANTPNLDAVCNNLGSWYVTADLCHTIYAFDPRSSTAELPELGVIAANLTVMSARVVVSDFKDHLSANTSGADLSPEQRTIIGACLQNYTQIVTALNGTIELMQFKNYTTAQNVLTKAMLVPQNCDEAATDAVVRALVSDDDSLFQKVMAVAGAVAGYLLNYYGT